MKGENRIKCKLDYNIVRVIGSFILHFITMGIIQSFGILFSELLETFEGNNADTSWVASINTGVMMLSGPVAGVIITKTNCRIAAMLGCFLAGCGMAFSALVNSLNWLYLTYGLLAGFGFGLGNLSAAIVINIHCANYRAFAMGLAASGSGVGTIVMPLFLRYCLDTFGWKGTFVMMAGVCMQGIVFGALLSPGHILPTPVDEELHEKNTNQISSKHLKKLLCKPQFICLTLGGTLMNMAFILPFVFLPDLMLQKGFSKYEATLPVTVAGIAGVIGRPFVGWIADVDGVNRSVLCGGLFIIGGIATTLGGHMDSIYLYMSYGGLLAIFTGSLAVLNPVIAQDIIGRDFIGLATGIIYFFNGLLILIGTPIGGVISDYSGSYNETFYFAGAVFILGGFVFLLIPLGNPSTKRKYEMTIETNTIDGSFRAKF